MQKVGLWIDIPGKCVVEGWVEAKSFLVEAESVGKMEAEAS